MYKIKLLIAVLIITSFSLFCSSDNDYTYRVGDIIYLKDSAEVIVTTRIVSESDNPERNLYEVRFVKTSETMYVWEEEILGRIQK